MEAIRPFPDGKTEFPNAKNIANNLRLLPNKLEVTLMKKIITTKITIILFQT